MATPTVMAFLMALWMDMDAARTSSYAALAHVLFVVLSVVLCGSSALLQALAIRSAAADLGTAAHRLAHGKSAEMVVGAIDTHLVSMARAFNAAAGEVARSRHVSAARYAALFEGAGDAIMLLDAATGSILEANRRAAGADRARRASAQGDTLRDALPHARRRERQHGSTFAPGCGRRARVSSARTAPSARSTWRSAS